MSGYSKLLAKQIKENKKIFWDVSDLENLSEFATVERILNYGDIYQFKEITKDKDSFTNVYKELKRKRNNLSPLIINYIDLYLKKNA